ncbi:glycosyltransferase family 2 protein [Flavobacterium luteolum]|uniref:glycosyltransferase family 2 protein n=1 Tax=Flavobacterium luteolum TaxID=3003259 RepID=UPI00248D3E38|nr:glycosyltransferase [Flavobacterium luteolum]
MISIVIRNKNEGRALENTLSILTRLYSNDFEEIIIVDNNSTDNSIEVAKKYNCKIVTIDNFSYGRAINFGIEKAACKYILLLSSHSIPIGNNFFKNTLLALGKSDNIAGVRYINSIENYNRAIQNNFKIQNPINCGLLASCCIINKETWKENKFDETLLAVEDKEWSVRVMEKGYDIIDLNETFFYFINRDTNASLKKYRIETIASSRLTNKKAPSLARIFGSFLKKIIFFNTINYFKTIGYAVKVLRTNLEIRKGIKSND